MKRICIGLLTALGCIAVATALIVRPFSKKSIQSYVLRNQDELTNYARKVIEEHPMGPLEWNGWKVYYYADDMLPQYLVLMNIGWLDSLKGLLIMTAFQPWMILLFWFAAKRIDSSLFDSAICDGASNWGLFRKIYAPIVRPYVMIAAFLSIAESWNLLEQPMTFLQSKEKYPLSMILMQLSTDNAELKNVLCLLFAIPLMILFGTMVKKIIDT